MGGLRKVMPFTHAAVPRRGARARRHPAALGLLVEGRDHLAPRSPTAARSAGSLVVARRSLGALLTGAYTFRLYFLVFHGRAVRPRARRTPAGTSTPGADGHGAHGHGEGPLSMLIPVGVLTVLAAIGGLLVIPGVWEPFLDWIDSAVEPLVEPDRRAGLRDERRRRHDRGRSASSSPGAPSRPASELVGRRPAAHRARAQALLRRALRRGCSRGRPR